MNGALNAVRVMVYCICAVKAITSKLELMEENGQRNDSLSLDKSSGLGHFLENGQVAMTRMENNFSRIVAAY